MKKISINDPIPDDARSVIHRDNNVYCYFDIDPEIVESRIADDLHHAAMQRSESKRARMLTVNKLMIITSSGNNYNADETSQQRIARAILVMDDSETITWTLADNTHANITRAELREALKLAVQQQTAVLALD